MYMTAEMWMFMWGERVWCFVFFSQIYKEQWVKTLINKLGFESGLEVDSWITTFSLCATEFRAFCSGVSNSGFLCKVKKQHWKARRVEVTCIIKTRRSSLEKISLTLLVSPMCLYAPWKQNVPSSCVSSDLKHELDTDLLEFTVSLDRFAAPWIHVLHSCRSKRVWYS